MITELEKRRHELTGRCLRQEEALGLASRLPIPCGWLLDLMRHYPLIGTTFCLSQDHDLSGLGVDMSWMTPEDILCESLELYPGIAAIGVGYVPVGMCLRGSGDPYFLKGNCDNPPLVRIPHDGLQSDLSLSESVIEIVRPQLSDFFRITKI